MDWSPFKFKLPSAMLAPMRQERQPHSTGPGTRILITYRVLVVVTTSQLLYRVLEVPRAGLSLWQPWTYCMPPAPGGSVSPSPESELTPVFSSSIISQAQS
jgi:hypothetical protein